MGAPARMPRTKPAAQRRTDLMDAAERLFLEHGFAPTTVEQITDAARVAKGTFYLYFASKDALRAALGERYGEAHLASTAAAVERASSWQDKLRAWIEASVDFYLDTIQQHDMLFYQGRSPTREGLTDNRVTEQLEHLLRAGSAARAWAVAEPHSAAVFLFAGVHAVVDDAVTRERRVQRSRLVRRVSALARRALAP